MNDERTLERAARSFIEVGPTRAPEQAVDSALLRIQTTPQERDWIPWRLFPMITPTRAAVAAVLGVLLLGGAYFTFDRLGQPAVGVPGPSASPSPSVTPAATSPSPATIVGVRMADALLGDWQATTTDAILGVSEAGEGIQLSIDWQEGETAWIQPSQGELSLHSTSVATPAIDELRFVSTERLGGCTPGDEGRYRWERSSDGLFLTLTVIEDACDSRAAAFGRTWVHSLSAVTDGGSGVIPFTNGWLQADIPSMRWGLSGDTDVWDLQTFDDGDLPIAFRVFRNPLGLSDPCDTSRVPIEIGRTSAAFVDYMNALPGLDATTVDAVIDGHPATQLTVASDDGVMDCVLQSTGEVMAFHAADPTADGEWGLTPLGPHTMWVVEVDGDLYLLWYEGVSVATSDAQEVIDSIRFLDQLPTP